MISSLRAFFLSRALREKILLVAFIGIGAAWWLSSFVTRAGKFWREQRSMTSQLAVQTQWINNRTQIEASAQQTASQLDPSKTLNGLQLATTVGQIASDAGLKNATSGSPSTKRSGQFAVHSVEYTIRGAEWDSLKKFYAALQKQSPYIAVEKFILSATPNNPAQLTLGLTVVSVEIAR